jgi:ADP-heptose:LPS heptosyltransferase
MVAADHIIARAPNHLGDGVMALPALLALSKVCGRFEIQAPPWGAELYRDLDGKVVERGPMPAADIAVLFPPSFRVAWEARRARRRVGVASDWRGLLLTDVVDCGLHQAGTYRALAAAVGASVEGAPIFGRTGDLGAPEVAPGHIGLNPISKAGVVREWQGFRRLAARFERPVVFYGGPGEERRVQAHGGGYPLRVGLSLARFAQSLRRCALFISNDSGAAHFARACGVPTLVVYGSTTAARTGPPGASAVEGPDLDCRPCYGRRCMRALECLDIPVERVFSEAQRVLSDG